MQAIGGITGNLHAIAKEVDNAQKKVEKLRERGGKASAEKVASAQQELEIAQSSWDSQAPYVFEKLQEVDERRCNHMRDVLTLFHTHEVDQLVRSRTIAEESLNTLLIVETADEIKTWSLKTTSGQPTLERKRSNRPSGSLAANLVATNILTPPTPTVHADDGASQKSGSGKLIGLISK
jgi:F-BAR domain only protein